MPKEWKQDIIINTKPKDTAQEAEFTKSLVDNDIFILVTSATHMRRSMELFESLGLHPIAAPTDFHKKEYKSFLITPELEAIRKSSLAMHEYLGILWNRLIV